MEAPGPVAAILLAADFDREGALRCIADSDAIEAAIGTLARAAVDELVVVLGEPAGTLAFQMAAPVTTVRRDAAWQHGIARGIANGLRALQPDSVAIVLATAALGPAHARELRRVVRRFRRGESAMFAFERDGQPVLPVLVDRRYRSVLAAVRDGADPAAVIAAHPDGCVLVAPGSSTPSPATE